MNKVEVNVGEVETANSYVNITEPPLVGAVQLAVNPVVVANVPVPTVGALCKVVKVKFEP